MNCERAKANISLYLYNELDEGQREALKGHLDGCQSCTRALAEERRFLQTLDQRQEAAPSEALLAQCRHDLMRGIDRAEGQAAHHPAAVPGARWWAGLQRVFASARFAWQPTAALVLLAVGFYAGRIGYRVPLPGLTSPPVERPSQASLLPMDVALSDIQSVQVDPERGEVEIVVEEVTRRTISGAPQDPYIRGLLISAVRNYPISGVRLDTLDVLTPRVADFEVRRALLAAMVEDDNPGVRLKALEALKSHKDDPGVRKALIQVLRSDGNPGMRVEAIELLTESPDRELVGLLQDLVHSEENNYVRLRCRRTLQDLNASVDRF